MYVSSAPLQPRNIYSQRKELFYYITRICDKYGKNRTKTQQSYILRHSTNENFISITYPNMSIIKAFRVGFCNPQNNARCACISGHRPTHLHTGHQTHSNTALRRSVCSLCVVSDQLLIGYRHIF